AGYAIWDAVVGPPERGAVPVADAAEGRGSSFLLNPHHEGGTWYVKSRSARRQPFFESDFPRGNDQWISAAATSWATMALAPAAERPARRGKMRRRRVKGGARVMTQSLS